MQDYIVINFHFASVSIRKFRMVINIFESYRKCFLLFVILVASILLLLLVHVFTSPCKTKCLFRKQSNIQLT
jgi:hypothetical protein